MVTQHGTIIVNRTQWMILQGILEGDLWIVNISASNDSHIYCQL